MAWQKHGTAQARQSAAMRRFRSGGLDGAYNGALAEFQQAAHRDERRLQSAFSAWESIDWNALRQCRRKPERPSCGGHCFVAGFGHLIFGGRRRRACCDSHSRHEPGNVYSLPAVLVVSRMSRRCCSKPKARGAKPPPACCKT